MRFVVQTPPLGVPGAFQWPTVRLTARSPTGRNTSQNVRNPEAPEVSQFQNDENDDAFLIQAMEEQENMVGHDDDPRKFEDLPNFVSKGVVGVTSAPSEDEFRFIKTKVKRPEMVW